MKYIIAFLIITIFACKKTSTDCQSNASLRAGAWCNDGTRTNSTDSSACAGFGGVREWICK